MREGGILFFGGYAELDAGWVIIRREVLKRVRAAREHKYSMPNFEVVDCMMVARIRKVGSAPKLLRTSTGHWRVILGWFPYV